ncbi:SpoIIE family protein phosphatase [Streptomyces sp. NPDC001507]|uniref:SpoIIE family protein phosphatase n=1 Tax=Streptomyces sp. NPDC001507 TaxID=3364579 RepID=UPI0036CF835F
MRWRKPASEQRRITPRAKNPVTWQCTIARAGHPPPAIIGPGGVSFPELPAAVPFGVGLVPFESVTLQLQEGSVLALYTDGLIENRGHDLDEGMNRLGGALTQPGLLLEDLGSAAMDTMPLQAPGDDATLLLARARSLGLGQVATWPLARNPSDVRRARALATRQLDHWGLEQLHEQTELIISELITDALRDGEGPIQLRLIRHQVLTCEVQDTIGSFSQIRHPHSTDPDGRGLLLIDELSRRWGTRRTPAGKIIWAEQQLPSGRMSH